MSGATPLIDFTKEASVLRALSREKANTKLYAALGFGAGVFLVGIAVSDGLQPFDFVYFVVSALVLVFGASALASLFSFEATNPGLKVYPSGLSLPWRSRLAARKGEENFLPFHEIQEIRFHLRAERLRGVIVIRGAGALPKEFEIESKWIPDHNRFAEAIRGKVTAREINEGS